MAHRVQFPGSVHHRLSALLQLLLTLVEEHCSHLVEPSSLMIR
jgi:hypothetical protein